MNSRDLYVVGGRDISSFVSEWVAALVAGGGESRGLLEHAIDDSSYFYGGIFMMSNIASRATAPQASEEELLLFAVLSVFQLGDFPGVDPELWEGEKIHLGRAFTYFEGVGEQEAARRLRAEVVRRSLEEKPLWWKELKQRRPRNPAREAHHDRDMASIDHRSLRAAQLLDPTGDFDSELRGFLSPED